MSDQKTTHDAAIKAMEAELAAEVTRLDAARKAREQAAESPEAKALELKAKLDAARAATAAEERAAADDRSWLEAQAQHGARVKRIHTADGDFILRANTSQEWDAIQVRAEAASAAALEAGDAVRANTDAMKAYREGILTKSLVHPAVATARAILDKYPGAWVELIHARDELNRGPRAATGKGDAR